MPNAFVLVGRLVPRLDYYNRTVFEWVTERLGAQGAVCSGGRYDGLVEQLGGRPTPAIGWALGMERLVELLDAWVTPSSLLVVSSDLTHFLPGDVARRRDAASHGAMALAEKSRATRYFVIATMRCTSMAG